MLLNVASRTICLTFCYIVSHRSVFFNEAEKDEAVTKTQTFTLKSGNELDVRIGRERFHAPEILFQVIS